MDAEHRQKVILAGVAVLALGAGSFWYWGRDSGTSNVAAIEEGAVQRKDRIVSDEPPKRPRDDPRMEIRDEPTEVRRREREDRESTDVERKPRRPEKNKEKRKNFDPPA